MKWDITHADYRKVNSEFGKLRKKLSGPKTRHLKRRFKANGCSASIYGEGGYGIRLKNRPK